MRWMVLKSLKSVAKVGLNVVIWRNLFRASEQDGGDPTADCHFKSNFFNKRFEFWHKYSTAYYCMGIAGDPSILVKYWLGA